jgi:hypothetical protein
MGLAQDESDRVYVRGKGHQCSGQPAAPRRHIASPSSAKVI